MTNKELRKLTREDLLELLLEQADAVEKQQRETDNIKKKCSRLEEENDHLRRELSLLKESWDKSEEETEKLREALEQEKAKNRAPRDRASSEEWREDRKKEEVPENWGLFYYKNGKFRCIKQIPKNYHFIKKDQEGVYRKDWNAECQFLVNYILCSKFYDRNNIIYNRRYLNEDYGSAFRIEK